MIALQSKEPVLPPLRPRKRPDLRDGATPDENLHGFLLFGARRVCLKARKMSGSNTDFELQLPFFSAQQDWMSHRPVISSQKKIIRLDVGHCQVRPDQLEQQCRVGSEQRE